MKTENGIVFDATDVDLLQGADRGGHVERG